MNFFHSSKGKDLKTKKRADKTKTKKKSDLGKNKKRRNGSKRAGKEGEKT